MVGSVALLHQDLHIIFLSGHETDRGALLAGLGVPLIHPRANRDRGDRTPIENGGIRREQQFALTVSREPEAIIAGHRSDDPARHPQAVVVSHIAQGLRLRDQIHIVRLTIECPARRYRSPRSRRGCRSTVPRRGIRESPSNRDTVAVAVGDDGIQAQLELR